MENPIKNKNILLGVCGSIAAYKAVELASQLTKAGANVDVILTPSAEKLVSSLTFRSVTGRKVFTDADLWDTTSHIAHINLALPADIMLVAPATASTIAKLAHGHADNLLTLTALAIRCSLVVAPAMDAGMYSNPFTQENLKILAQHGISILGPDEGHLASGLTGKGRMLEPRLLFSSLRFLLSRDNPLAGKKIIVTAGGTQEPIDPVRMLTNNSSGKQGYALAQAALDAGADVTLISAPTALTPPEGAKSIDIKTAKEMHAAVMEEVRQADAVIMAAAVADFRPTVSSKQKIKKEGKLQEIKLDPTVDILKELGEFKRSQKSGLVLIGFAAESENLLQNAAEKLAQKNLDLIIANDISRKDAGFAVDSNEVTLLFRDGKKQDIPLQNKELIAQEIIDILIRLMQS
ncbi:MAG: bifunctional phosphopantothenoylcysteine decarboxylase/phosphopantothenate--cysteine ligase CoaBC [Anaerolineaceae bacterium]|jgi:phosphopantothenoylcysteine decarboxylase/phosphopantothenate--cysteine ligase|nr:MAG: bifunctional phosphopantothenoylcysteine decarboxylase/phosphopantothenate--cysteine ligase CoaBC [Anaerolineaceae bacterium]